MNIKNNKGITLAVLVVTVIVIAIIASVSLNLGIDISETAKFEDVETSLLLIQSKTKIMYEKTAIGEMDEDEYYGTKVASGEYSGWYLLSQGELGQMGLSDLDADDLYYVDYENQDVAYGAGVKMDGQTFYKLSDILDYIGD